jgi:hypothetical protein
LIARVADDSAYTAKNAAVATFLFLVPHVAPQNEPLRRWRRCRKRAQLGDRVLTGLAPETAFGLAARR